MNTAVLRTLNIAKSFSKFHFCPLRFIFSDVANSQPQLTKYNFLKTNNDETLNAVKNCIFVYDDFVNETEENKLLSELENELRRHRYEDSHWDDVCINVYGVIAIHKFRETEKAHWSNDNRAVIERIQKFAFSNDVKKLNYVHVLDLAEDGIIKPHIDSVRFCGRIIAGLSLSSSSVMRLVHEKNKNLSVDVLLKRRSLYVMKDNVRYEFTHEILGNNVSYFNGEHIKKGRRVSIICRCEPEN
ncbi:hypothetical protein B4U80_09309 [Leptotrombidium deliense]|uniref:Alpha-ketoglutarate-dependent dioxygenase alkB 7-like protein n=1 Tax=Leptotrombidium deliense TaxID=299467 RepID=A0A443RWR0_9ACAR|nr:hypothetical protein B4U80_09309 [Leptotrombidium deliense]